MITMKPVNFSSLKTLFFLFLAALLATGCTQANYSLPIPAAETQCISTGWPQDNSDLSPDPALTYGILDNGFRYVIMRNEEPKDRVGLYLNIQAGSLAEDDDQLGYAHYLEHMLFNGTTHYPPGTLVEYFQSIGMGYGSDTNAHTTFDETVYRLLLPDGSEKNMHDGLLVMADYARGALLLEEEVEREKGIILAEKRTRDSVSYRLWEERTRFSFAGTRLAERFPIGTDETLQKANAESLRSFYDSWYRPENMILVVVGDVDSTTAEVMIKERFNLLVEPAAQFNCFDWGRVGDVGNSFLYVHEPKLGSTEITISSNWNVTPENDSVARQQKDIKEYIAILLLRNRLKQLVRKQGSPLTTAGAYSGDYLQRFGSATVTAKVKGENWQQGLQLLNQTVRQAKEKGFSQRELDQVKKEVMADLEKEVQTASSRDSRKLADSIIGSLNRNMVFMSPKQELQLYGPVVNSINLAEINTIFEQIWGHESRKVVIAGTAEIKGQTPPEEAVKDVFEVSQNMELRVWQENDVVTFPYLPFPEEVNLAVQQNYYDAIDVHRYTYGNGTVLNFKKTPFKENQVFVEVHFGYGKISEKIPGLGMLSQSVVNESGTGQLTKVELEEALAGHNVSVSFKVGRESFVYKGEGLSEEAELLFQLVSSRLFDPAFREDAYRLAMNRFSQMYEKMSTSVDGVMRLQGERFLAGGNQHYGYPPVVQFNELSLEQIREWLLPIFANAQLEVSVVGDIEPEQVESLAGKYFAGISRQKSESPDIEPVFFPKGKELKDTVATEVDKALVVVAWPTEDFWDISRTRRLNALASVFSERLRLEIRERLGAVYSPSVYNHSSRTQPGYGVLRAMLTVDPPQAEEVIDRVREVGEILARDGVEEEELRRSLEPALTSIKDMKETNRYWLQSVLALSSRHPEQLEWPLNIQQDYGAISAEEISEYARRYFMSEASAQLIFLPNQP